MRRHAAESFFAAFIHDLPDRIEATDERPVWMHSAAFCGEEKAARVRFKPQDRPFGFGRGAKEFCRRKAEAPGKAQGFVGRDPDRFVVTAGAAHVAFE
jgi:hypothetical protein